MHTSHAAQALQHAEHSERHLEVVWRLQECDILEPLLQDGRLRLVAQGIHASRVTARSCRDTTEANCADTRGSAHTCSLQQAAFGSARLGFVAEVRHLPLAAADLRCIREAAPQEDLQVRTRRSRQMTAAAARW
jgi:hypothetical protein